MNNDAVIEYNRILDTFELVNIGMKFYANNGASLEYDTIKNVMSYLLNDMRRFAVNHVGVLDH